MAPTINKFSLSIETDNDAFQFDESGAVADMLRVLANRLERGVEAKGKLFDVNGNRVGEYRFHRVRRRETQK